MCINIACSSKWPQNTAAVAPWGLIWSVWEFFKRGGGVRIRRGNDWRNKLLPDGGTSTIYRLRSVERRSLSAIPFTQARPQLPQYQQGLRL